MTTEQMTLIEDCEARESRLSEWERTFIDSVKNVLASGGSLSKKQDERLNEIWDAATARG